MAEQSKEHLLMKFYLQENLETMNRALRDYIIDQNNESLQNVLMSLKKKLNSDATAIDHLHLALYSFQVCSLCLFFKIFSKLFMFFFVFLKKDAVNTVLRSHSIKPHWMFALDSLVSTAVQAGITVLSPGTRNFFFYLSHIPICMFG